MFNTVLLLVKRNGQISRKQWFIHGIASYALSQQQHGWRSLYVLVISKPYTTHSLRGAPCCQTCPACVSVSLFATKRRPIVNS